MKDFANAINTIDFSTKTSVKKQALADYFKQASNEDKVWVIALFTHRRPKRIINTTLLRTWASKASDIPLWLFEESYHIVGDLAETIAQLLPAPKSMMHNWGLAQWFNWLEELRDLEEEEKEKQIRWAWSILGTTERFIFNKFITGGFRIGVSANLLANALAQYLQMDKADVQFRISGNWDPFTTTFQDLFGEEQAFNPSKPYPFYLAYPSEQKFFTEESPKEWQAEWKWDGIRGQLIKRGDIISLWSRGEELITERFPDIIEHIPPDAPDFVLDGEIICWQDGKPLPFQLLQKRIGRKKVGKKTLTEAPAAFIAYDLLEWEREDIRSQPLKERRTELEFLFELLAKPDRLMLSNNIVFKTWEELELLRKESRQRYTEGMMLKRKSSIYQSGRKRGDWYKWKIDPLHLDLVMIYAQRGHGRRANLYTDFTFAVRKGDALVPLTKAYSGLTDAEINEVNRFVKANTLDRFGPVRSVKPALVFELAFEGINKSTRNKSGFALRFPRISRWRKDKSIEEINTIEDVDRLWKAINPME
jgi:DNA ligase-1